MKKGDNTIFCLKDYMLCKKERVEKALERFLPGEDTYPPAIHKAMRYSIFAGGKRLRPILAIAAAEAVGGHEEWVMPAACALEFIHTYSLIHDDLPAMDNADYRRAKPTSHLVFGEAMAVLAGDALLTEAFKLMASSLFTEAAKERAVLQVIKEVAEAVGSRGLIGGQVVDLESESKLVDEETLFYIHSHKTGKLFCASVRAGALLAGADERQLACLTRYAENFGLAFQIRDDILDIEGNSKKMGKSVGNDARLKKATYPCLLGLERARKVGKEAGERAAEQIRELGENARPLQELALFIIKRDF